MTTLSNADKVAIVKDLIASHTHAVTVALQTFPVDERREYVINESLHQYTEMFLDKVNEIVNP